MANPIGQPVPQYPFLQPGVYSPGQVAFNNNPEMSQLISMFAGPLLGQMAGPGNFVPHMMPSQNLMDQYAMRQYQQQTNAARLNITRDPNEAVANRFLGLRSAFTNEPASELNREQAMQMAQMVNHPIAQMIGAQVMGAENFEMMVHGSRGNVQALNQAVNRMGYFRRDPQGGSRMDAESLTNFTRGMYSEMYEPAGDVKELAERARQNDASSIDQLKSAARITNRELVSDTDIAARISEKRPEEVAELYSKYVAGGKATDTAVQAQELTKFRRAIADSGVMKENETSVAALSDAAKRMGSADMFGLTAGQAGQLTEHLFQRGMMPQALGAMSAADRVRMIQGTTEKMDEGQLDRMARDYAHQSLMKDSSEAGGRYRQMTEVEQREEVEKRLPEFRTKLDDTREKLKKFTEGDTSVSATELEQLGGMDLMGSNVDASRSADTVKKYAGAVDAVREIFGDNGNPNAPMPALLAALNHLTQGSMGAMKPQQVQATLRQMQQVARETGIGFQQMAALSATMGAQGQMLGVSNSVTMQNVVGSMASIKAMQDSGSFAGVTTFGAMTRDEALDREGRLMQAGAASANSIGMASLASLYDVDPTRFAGTELEAAVKAFNDPNSDGKYTFDGQEKNLYEVVGKGGPMALQAMLERSGGNGAEFNAKFYDPATKDYVKADFGRRTQRFEAVRDLNMFVGQNFARKEGIEGTSLELMSDDDQTRMSRAVGETFTQMVIDTSTLGRTGQLDAIQKNLESKLVETFRQQGHANPEAAAAEVAKNMTANRSNLDQAVSAMGFVYKDQTGEALVREGQSASSTVAAAAGSEMQRANALQQRRADMNLGQYKTSPIGRAANYLSEIGESGEAFNAGNLMTEIAQIIPNADLRDTFEKEMLPMFREISEMQDQAYVTKTQIGGLAAQARSGDAAATTELRKHAGLKATDRILARDEETAEKQKAAEAIGEPQLKQVYESIFGGGAAKDMTPAQMRAKLSEGGGYKQYNSLVDQQLANKGLFTLEGVERRAEGSIGAVKDEKMARMVEQGLRAATNGEDTDQSRAFLSSMLDTMGVTDEDTRAKITKLTVDDASEDGGKELEKIIGGLGLDAAATERLGAVTSGLRRAQLTPLGRAGMEQAANENIQRPDAAARAQADAAEDRRHAADAAAKAKQTPPPASAQGAPTAPTQEKGWLASLTDSVMATFGYGEQQAPQVKTDADAKQKSDKIAVDANTAAVTADKIEVHGNITVDGKTTAATPTGAAPASTAATPAPQATQAPPNSAPPSANEPAAAPATQTPATSAVASAQVDKPLPPPGATQNTRTVYDLSGNDLIAGLGGADAIRADKNKQQVALQTAGLLGSLRDIKDAKGDTYREETAREIFSVKMRDAVNSGLIPHPVDEDGDEIADFEDDEAIAAAEKHLEQYLPKNQATSATVGDDDQKSAATRSPSQQQEIATNPDANEMLHGVPAANVDKALEEGAARRKTMEADERYQKDVKLFGEPTAAQRYNARQSQTQQQQQPKPDQPLPTPATEPMSSTDELLARIDKERAAIIEEVRSSGGDDAVQVLEDETAYAKVADKVADEYRRTNTLSDDTRAEEEKARDRFAYNRHAQKTKSPLAQPDQDVAVDTEDPAWEEEKKLQIAEKDNAVDAALSPAAKRLRQLDQARENAIARQQKVAQANDAEHLKNAGLSSANIAPTEIQQTTAFSAPAAVDSRVGTPVSLQNSLPDPQVTNVGTAGGAQTGSGNIPNTAQQNTPAASGAGGGMGGGNQNLNITGTLSLNGLREAILSGSGGQPIQTAGDGPPVVQNPPNYA